MAESPADLDALDLDDLRRLVVQLVEEDARLRAENSALREEIARLKGLKGPPKIKPSGMDKANDPRPGGRKCKRRGRGGKLSRLTIDEERIVKDKLLLALERPDISLHTNGSENDIPCQVTKRPGDQAQGLGRHARRRRPRRNPRPDDDLRQARRLVPGCTSAAASRSRAPPSSRPCPTSSVSAPAKPESPAFRRCYVKGW